MGLLGKASKDPERNALCPCGSKLKFKNCHGNEDLRQRCQNIARLAARQAMMRFIGEAQVRAGICPNCQEKLSRKRKCKGCGLEIVSQEEAMKRAQAEADKQIIVPDKKIIVPE